jgi:hypothetical protein
VVKIDVKQKEMRDDNNEKFKVLQDTLVPQMGVHQEKNALISEVKDG